MGELVGEQSQRLRRVAGLPSGQDDVVAEGQGIGTAGFRGASGRLEDPHRRRVDADERLEEPPAGLRDGHDRSARHHLRSTWRGFGALDGRARHRGEDAGHGKWQCLGVGAQRGG